MVKTNKKKYLFFINQDYSFAVLRPLQDEILKRGDEVKWFLYGEEIHYKYLKKDEKRVFDVKEITDFNPDAVFVPGNVVPSFISGLKVKVFHGLPSGKRTRKGREYHYDIKGMFDFYCTKGPKSTAKFKELSKEYGSFLVQETGWCKLDPLFLGDESKSSPKQKTIFFASTFSPRFSRAKILYPLIHSMMKKYDFYWYVTLHPKMDKDVVELYKSIDLDNVKFVETTEVIDAFKDADLMVCDTSSIMYEFLTQLKPVITFQTEKDEPHLINVEDIDKLEQTILSVLESPCINRDNIENSVKQFHPYRDGKSSTRVLDSVEKMLEEGVVLKKKPFNLVRNFKLRKELNYWKII